MPRASTGITRQQQVLSTSIPVSRRHQDRRQWFHLWCAERRREDIQGLEALWDAQREQVWTQTTDSYRDFVLQGRGPELRFAIYQHLVLS